METTGGSSDAQDARAALQQVQRAEKAVRGVEAPWWYFILSAALFAALILVQLLGERSNVYIAAVAMVIVAVNLLAARKAGVIGAGSRNTGFLLALFGVFVVVVVSIIWYAVDKQAWTVWVMAAAAAVLTLIGGWLYRRNPS